MPAFQVEGFDWMDSLQACMRYSVFLLVILRQFFLNDYFSRLVEDINFCWSQILYLCVYWKFPFPKSPAWLSGHYRSFHRFLRLAFAFMRCKM
jgi:hypothetical protein